MAKKDPEIYDDQKIVIINDNGKTYYIGVYGNNPDNFGIWEPVKGISLTPEEFQSLVNGLNTYRSFDPEDTV